MNAVVKGLVGNNQTRAYVLPKAILALAALSATVFGQTGPAAILTVDIENLVFYDQDTSDATKFATDPNIVPSKAHSTFVPQMFLADIVAVNGKPAKGTWTGRSTLLFSSATPTPGVAIADSPGSNILDSVFEIQQQDGTPIGTIMAIGWGGTPPPPGAPTSCLASNFTIIGGTGAFLGVRGQGAQCGNTINPRTASMVEDPSNRRINGGGKRRYIYHLLPMARPEIVNVWHADFSPVTGAKPAQAGEVLIASARGLGPTRPGVDPGVPFPSDKLQVVNSPIDITASGQPVEVLTQIGWPGQENLYRLDFRMPKVAGPATVVLQLSAAWIGGLGFNIPVQ